MSLSKSCMRGTWEGAPLLGIPKDMLSKALENGVCFHREPVLGNMGGGHSFPRAFEKRVRFFLSEELLLRNSTEM